MKNHWSCSIMSYQRGTTSNNFHLTTTYKSMSLFSPGKSWLLINLLYHVLGTNNHFPLSIKFDLLQLRNTHISDMLHFVHTFLETSPCADVTASLWDMWAKTHIFLNDNLLYFLPITVSFLTYLVIFTPDKTLLIFWLSLTYPFHVYDQS